jgi:hypothetical protein
MEDERPKAPWHPFPLVELAVLAGIVLLVVGFIAWNTGMLIAGMLLGSLGGLDTALREHFAGFRSHSTVLAGIPAVAAAAAVYFAGAIWPIVVVAAVAVFAAAAYLLTRSYARRAR